MFRFAQHDSAVYEMSSNRLAQMPCNPALSSTLGVERWAFSKFNIQPPFRLCVIRWHQRKRAGHHAFRP
jgi:hypothetical protein